jgi:sulfate/thiosulfate transport system substrate-binding protein
MSCLKPFPAPQLSLHPFGNARADRHKNRPVAEGYLRFLFSEAAQEIFAKFDYRPLLPSIADKYRDHFQQTELIDPEKAFGGWDKIQRTIFGDGGAFDRIYVR